jgi:hypothetical protein
MARKSNRKTNGKKAAGKPQEKPKRGAGGAFLPGNKEGAAGRPKGSRNRTTLMVEAILDGEAESLTRRLIAEAKRGNATAMGIVFARLAPPRRDRGVTFNLPKINSSGDLLAAHAAIIAAAADGEVTPSEAVSMTSVLDHYRRATETAQIEERLAALEARLTADNHS